MNFALTGASNEMFRFHFQVRASNLRIYAIAFLFLDKTTLNHPNDVFHAKVQGANQLKRKFDAVHFYFGEKDEVVAEK